MPHTSPAEPRDMVQMPGTQPPRAGRNLDHVESFRRGRRGVPGNAVQIGQCASLGVVGIDICAYLKQSVRIRVAERRQSRVLVRRQRSDVRLDVRIRAPVDERNACSMADEPERGSIHDTRVHRRGAVDSQSQRELRL